MGRKSLLSLALLALVLVGAWFYLRVAPAPQVAAAEPLLPALQGRVADVEGILVEAAELPPLRLARGEAGWVVPDKAGYPADAGAVGRLLRALVEARKVEAKTANREWHARLGLAERGDGQATRISLSLPQRQSLQLLVGKPAQQLDGQLVRLAGDDQVWLIDKPIELPLEELQWLDRRVLAVPFESTREVLLRYTAGGELRVFREDAGQPNFQAQGKMLERQSNYQIEANALARLFERLDFADAAPLAQLDFSGPALLRYELRTFQGGELEGALYQRGEDYWLTLEARDGLAAEQVPGSSEWAYRIAPERYRTMARSTFGKP